MRYSKIILRYYGGGRDGIAVDAQTAARGFGKLMSSKNKSIAKFMQCPDSPAPKKNGVK